MARHQRVQRIAAAVLQCLRPAVWVLWVTGIAAFLLLPLAAKRCYLDEKALLVGGALPTIRQSGALDACVSANNQLQTQLQQGDLAALVQAAAAAAGGLQLYRQNYTSGSGQQCSTLHSVVRSPRGDGSEGFVLLMPLDSSNRAAAALAAAAGMALAGHLRGSRWLAKDAVLVFTDAACGTVESADEWVAAYNSGHDLFNFPRAGLLQQALVLELSGTAAGAAGAAGAAAGASAAAPATAPPRSPGSAGSAELSVHGSGGQLPNLDLYYLVKRNLDMHTTLAVSLRPSAAPLPLAVQRGAAALGNAAAALGIAGPAAAQRYAAEIQTVAAFSMQLAGGEPTGGHAAFLSHQIDAATLRLRLAAADPGGGTGAGAAAAGSVQARHQLQLAAYSTLAAAEMVLRTFNNLQERLHHSTALYVLVAADRFASIALYLAPPACLLAAALAQLVVTSRAAADALPAAWHAGWRRAAAAYAVAAAASPAAGPTLSSLSLHGGLLACAQQWAWAAAAGLAAAEGLVASMAALRLDSSGMAGSLGAAAAKPAAAAAAGSAARHCTLAAGLAGLVLQAAYCILTRWVQCCSLLLAAVPLYSLAGVSLAHGGNGSSRLATVLIISLAGVLCYALGGTAWLPALLPHILVVAATAVSPS